MSARHRVVIIGGGFGGLQCAQSLAWADADVTLIDRRNFHLFQPLLYQVATGGLSPANIAAPLRAVLRKQRNVTVLLGEVTDIDLDGRFVVTDGGKVPYDSLVVATGARHHYFGHPEWEAFAPGLKSIEDATAMRRRILGAFERAERESDPALIQALLTFIVVGGGPTGVELAGAVAELAEHTLRGNFRRINPASARVLLVEAGDRIMASYHPSLSDKAVRDLNRLGVTVLVNTAVTNVTAEAVTLKSAAGDSVIPTRCVLWGAGVAASPLVALVAKKAGATLDRVGRLQTAMDCTVPGRPEVFVLGDASCFLHQNGKPLPGVAQVALQMGKYAAEVIYRRAANRPPPPPFVYKDPGNMATIGRASAIMERGWVRLSGFVAWLAWLFVHIVYLIRFENRAMVMFQWGWSYLTWGRTARLITETRADTVPETKAT